MRRKQTLIVVSVAVAVAAVVAVVSAGDPDNPPGSPEATYSHTLDDIYNRLDTGAATTPITFTEPASGPPTGTMHTLDEIYDLIGQRAFVPKTGQTTSYRAGDDGDLEMGVNWFTGTRFITGTTGSTGVTVVVTDTLTGLVWLQDANCIANEYPGFDVDDTSGDGEVTWPHALDFVAGITVTGAYSNCAAGFSDWRLPNVRELQSLIDYGEDDPALPDGHPFTGVEPELYWSSTYVAQGTPHAWAVFLYSGDVGAETKAYTLYVWPVRGGQ